MTVSSDSAAGASSAPKAPWQARATTSMPKLPAAPPNADAPAKPMRPAMNVAFRPIRSVSLPPRSSRLPKAREYAVTTHCRSMSEKPRTCWAEGSAMFTIVASSTTISWASATTARISQRRGSGPADVAGLAQVGAGVCAAMWFMVLDPFGSADPAFPAA